MDAFEKNEDCSTSETKCQIFTGVESYHLDTYWCGTLINYDLKLANNYSIRIEFDTTNPSLLYEFLAEYQYYVTEVYVKTTQIVERGHMGGFTMLPVTVYLKNLNMSAELLWHLRTLPVYKLVVFDMYGEDGVVKVYRGYVHEDLLEYEESKQIRKPSIPLEYFFGEVLFHPTSLSSSIGFQYTSKIQSYDKIINSRKKTSFMVPNINDLSNILIYRKYVFDCYPNCYVNLRLDVRELFGEYNNDVALGCTNGGVFVGHSMHKQNIHTNKWEGFTQSFQICNGFANQTFMKDGVTFPPGMTHFIAYAYMERFTCDFTLHVSYSYCAGILNPCLMCNGEMREMVVRLSDYVITCRDKQSIDGQSLQMIIGIMIQVRQFKTSLSALFIGYVLISTFKCYLFL